MASQNKIGRSEMHSENVWRELGSRMKQTARRMSASSRADATEHAGDDIQGAHGPRWRARPSGRARHRVWKSSRRSSGYGVGEMCGAATRRGGAGVSFLCTLGPPSCPRSSSLLGLGPLPFPSVTGRPSSADRTSIRLTTIRFSHLVLEKIFGQLERQCEEREELAFAEVNDGAAVKIASKGPGGERRCKGAVE